MGGAEVGEAGGPCQTPHVRWVQGAPRASRAFGETCFQACGRYAPAGAWWRSPGLSLSASVLTSRWGPWSGTAETQLWP